MSVSSTIRIAGPYSGNGSTVTFPFAFKVFQPSEVVVVQTDINGVEVVLTITTDYTVTLNADQDENPGGAITMLTAPAVGHLITLGSNVDALQDLTLTNQGGFYPKVINDALDRITIVAQQILNKLGGVLKVGITDGSIGNLPTKGMRSYMGLGFDANGDPIAVPLSNLVNAIPTQEKGAALGVATLDANGKLVQMPTSDDIDPAIQTHITSPHAPVAAEVNRPIATNAQALAGTNNTVDMTPLRVKEVVDAIPMDNSRKVRLVIDNKGNGFPERWSACVTESNEILVWGYDVSSYIQGYGPATAGGHGATTLPHPLGKENIQVQALYTTTWGLFVLYADGDLFSRGYNGFGQLGVGNTAVQYDWVLSATGVSKFATASDGYHQSYNSAFIIKIDGSLWACGLNNYGNLGVGDVVQKTSWTACVGLPAAATDPVVDVVTVICNVGTSYALTQSGKVYACGYNAYGALGQGTTTNSSTFLRVLGLLTNENVVAISVNGGGSRLGTGGYHRAACAALTATGKVFGWGWNQEGALGIGNAVNQTSPVEVVYSHNNTTDPVARIYGSHTAWNNFAYVTTSGALYTMGYNDYGQLGVGNTIKQTLPQLVNVPNVKDVYWQTGGVYCYHRVMLIVTTDNKLFACGYNVNGNVGDGTTVNKSLPTQIRFPNYSPVSQVMFGGYSDASHWLVALANGELWGWGRANSGQVIPTSTSPFYSYPQHIKL